MYFTGLQKKRQKKKKKENCDFSFSKQPSIKKKCTSFHHLQILNSQ